MVEMEESTQKYQKVHADFRILLNTALSLSAAMQNQEVETRELEVGSWLFAKTCAHAQAIYGLAPQGPLGGPAPEHELWDISSMAVLVRAEVDTYYAFFYVAVDEIDAEMREFRWLLWDHHSELHRLKKLQLIGSASPAVLELEQTVEELTKNVKEHAVYLRQNTSIQKKLRKGEFSKFATNADLSGRARIDPSYFKAVFMFLSSYVHAHSFSINQLSVFRAGEEKSLHVITVVLRYAVIYLALAIRDFLSLMRNEELNIDFSSKQLVEFWCGVAANFSQFQETGNGKESQ